MPADASSRAAVAASAAAAAVAVTKAAAARATAKITYNLRQQARSRRSASSRAAAAGKPAAAKTLNPGTLPAGAEPKADPKPGQGEASAKPGAAAAAAAAAERNGAGGVDAAARVRAAVLQSLDEAAAGGSLAELTPEDLFPGACAAITGCQDWVMIDLAPFVSMPSSTRREHRQESETARLQTWSAAGIACFLWSFHPWGCVRGV